MMTNFNFFTWKWVFLLGCIFTVCDVLKSFWKLYFIAYFHKQTSTAHLIQNQQVEAQTQPEPRGSTSSVSQAEAAYENVSVIHPSQTSSTRHGLGSTPSQTVDTVYSVLEAPKVSNRSKDTKGHRKTGDAPTSQSVTPGEAEHCVQIDTVYSMLQKPKKKSEVTAPQIGQWRLSEGEEMNVTMKQLQRAQNDHADNYTTCKVWYCAFVYIIYFYE